MEALKLKKGDVVQRNDAKSPYFRVEKLHNTFVEVKRVNVGKSNVMFEKNLLKKINHCTLKIHSELMNAILSEKKDEISHLPTVRWQKILANQPEVICLYSEWYPMRFFKVLRVHAENGRIRIIIGEEL